MALLPWVEQVAGAGPRCRVPWCVEAGISGQKCAMCAQWVCGEHTRKCVACRTDVCTVCIGRIVSADTAAVIQYYTAPTARIALRSCRPYGFLCTLCVVSCKQCGRQAFPAAWLRCTACCRDVCEACFAVDSATHRAVCTVCHMREEMKVNAAARQLLTLRAWKPGE